MPSLKIRTIKQIDVQDWNNLVIEIYGKPYSLQQQDGCKSRGLEYITVPVKNPYDYENDSISFIVNGNEMGVSFKAWDKSNYDSVLEEFKEQEEDTSQFKLSKFYTEMFYERNFYPSIDMIINDLHNQGLLEEGEYQINIDW